jgi:DUF4097 and DUF4098 domain-containing protein YvlB
MSIKKSVIITILITISGVVLQASAALPVDTDPSFRFENLQQEPHERRVFQVDGIPDLTVLTVSGDVEVIHNPDIDEVIVELYVRRGYRLLSGRNNLRNYRILINQRGNQINATVEQRRGDSGWFSDNLNFSFLVQVPRELTSSLRTMNGSITVDGVIGNQILQSNSGNISIHNVEGQVQANSASGGIYVSNSAGQFNLRTVANGVQVEGLKGEVRARTASGNIHVNDLDGTLVCATASGNIDARFTDVTYGIHAESASGNIQLYLPENRGYQLDIRGGSINLDRMEPFDGTIRGRSASGRVGDGSIPLQISTASGRVTLRLNGQLP